MASPLGHSVRIPRVNDADAVREFLTVFGRDREQGAAKELAEYQSLFPGHEQAFAVPPGRAAEARPLGRYFARSAGSVDGASQAKSRQT